MNSSRSRFKAEVHLLLTLEASRLSGCPALGRLHVQKLSYLGRVLAPLRGILEYAPTFEYDMNGPYSSAIQNMLDHLVAIGLVNMSGYKIVALRDQERAKYAIAEDGSELVQQLVDNHRKHALELDWLRSVYRIVTFYGLDKILDLVYQEPTFKTLRLKGARGAELSLDGAANETLGQWFSAQQLLLAASGKRPSREDLLWLYFQSLSAQAAQESDVATAEGNTYHD